MNGMIRWFEDSQGIGCYKLSWDDGSAELIECGDPIGSRTNSDDAAAMFGHKYEYVEKDRDVIHVGKAVQ